MSNRTSLATTNALQPPALTTEHWARTNDKVRAKFRLLEAAMQALGNAPARGLTKAYELEASKLRIAGIKLSASRLKKLYEEFRSVAPDGGEYALIDHRLCRGCALPGCNSPDNRSTLHELTIDAWVDLATSNKQIKRTGTMVLRNAWRTLVLKICAGTEPVPGVASGLPGTWQDIWRMLKPDVPTPSRCPWDDVRVPPGYSYQNFMARKPAKAVIASAQRGMAHLRKHLPEVRLDLSQLRPLEAVMIDDHRIDVLVMGEWAGRPQLVELWALFIMDLATRRILWVQLHPRYEDENGQRVGIRARDVQHAFAHMFRAYGVPLTYRCEIVCENAAAVITEPCEQIIRRATEGRVTVRRSGTFDKKLLLSGWGERGGSPNGKAQIESFFHRFGIAFGNERGQIGRHYMLKPGELERQLQHADRMISRVGNVATDAELQRLIVEFHDMQTVRPSILAALHHIETNPQHQLQGFEQVRLWRMHEDDKWRTLTDPAMTSLVTRFGLDYVNDLLRDPAHSVSRMETVRERWQRLYNPDAFARPSPEALFEMWLDEVPAQYKGGDILSVNLGRRGGGEHEFCGSRHHLQPGQQIVVRFDFDHPEEGAWLYAPDGRPLGCMDYRARTQYGDEDGLLRQLKEKAQAESSLLKDIRRIKETRPVLQERLALAAARYDTLQTIDQRTKRELAATAHNQAFIDSLGADAEPALPEESPDQAGSPTDFYLRLNRR